ncbi:quinon protein alcohol dehydrogenase-like superfamily [Globomyces pollinis-pini]|nr:quinon protein alcohol dehydrogenase-like superfamily [Globomyces pollinis-pini]
MAMEFRHAIMDIHPKPVLCVQYNPFRREIMTAGEDATIRVWESESGKLLSCWTEHIGWVTNLLYCKELKVLFSSSIDGYIIAWGPSGKPLQKIQTGSPVYCLAYNFRRQQIMAGQNKKVRLFQLIGEDALSKVTTDVLEKKSVSCSEHLDIVSCLVSCEGRFYSAGYDRKIVIYDVPHHGDLKLRVASTIKDAHDASISCMIFGKDADNSWLITGSIDRVVKLWSLDGNLMQRFDGFNDTITSLCYVIPTQTLWVTANSPLPVVYDPRSGINVSDFVRTDDERFHVRGGTFGFRNLLYIPETMEVVAISTRRSLVVWKYNSVAPLTVLPGHIDIAECLAFNSKEPILIFSGGDDGIIHKWERLQLNTFMYSQEALVLPKEEFNDVVVEPPPAVIEKKSLKTVRMKRRFDRGPAPKEIKAAVDTFLPKTKKETVVPNKTKAIRPGVVSMSYFEDLDLLISGYEDSRIRVWGYNEESIVYTQETHGMGSDSKTDERVTSRVAGMSLKVTLCEHKDAVTALSCFKKDGASWLLSTGWDRKICLWNLNELRLQDVFKNSSATSPWKEELAADGIILDLEYSSERNEFGYCSSDKLAYIRKFSTNGANMKLQAVLQGHEAEVTQIKWHKQASQWITGSEDRTVRIWAAEGIPMLRVINNDGPVTAICVDTLNKCIITGSQDKVIRVFDIEKKDEIVQKHMGHSDEIRSIIHIPSRNQYVSAAWDNTVRVWNAFLKKGQRKATKTVTKYAPEEDENVQSYSEMNPLIIPKLLSKPVFVKEFVLEKAPVKEDDDEIEKSALEEELRQTLNDLDAALNSPDKISQNKANLKTRVFKGNKSKKG